ncbi:MAG: alpha/beta fold hydrolase [Bacteroidetes bacterium]|nr:alpha/beta fold hydrolase [Bacteroidota bacterium]
MLFTAKTFLGLATFAGAPGAGVAGVPGAGIAGTPGAGGENAAPRTYVLVHGAWTSSAGWEPVKELLEKAGQKVILVSLPGHGDDQTPPGTLTMDVYRDKTIEAINAIQGKVILVGHSMAGMVISAVAEKIPNRIDKLVYLAAYLPANGQSLLDLATTDKDSYLGNALMPSEDHTTIGIKKDVIVPAFCQDAPDGVKSAVVSTFRAEPAIPFTNKVTLTAANFGHVPKYYIHTLQDHTVSSALQKRMVAAAPKVVKEYSLDSSHTPFLSMPGQLVDLLLEIVK